MVERKYVKPHFRPARAIFTDFRSIDSIILTNGA
jgi:hypothetical protein